MRTEGDRLPVASKTILKLAVSAVFVAVVIHKVDMRATLAALSSVNAGAYWVSFLILLANSVLLAAKFKIAMAPSGIHRTLAALFRINLTCRFYAFFLTSAVGQGLIRWFSTTKDQKDRSKFITVMVFERASFLLVLCLAVVLLQLAMPPQAAMGFQRLIYSLAAAGIAAMGILLAFLFSPAAHRALTRLIGRTTHVQTLPLAGRFLRDGHLFDIYLSRTPVLTKCLVIAVLWHFFYLLRVYLLIIAIGTPIGFLAISWMASLVLLLQAVPITLNGIGLRESAYAALFSLASLPPEEGVLLGLLFFSQMLLVSAIGGVAVLIDRG